MSDGETGRLGDGENRTLPQSPRHRLSQSAPIAAGPLAASIRQIESSDLEALYRLDQVCFEPGIAYSRPQLRAFLGMATAQAVLAESGGRLAGFAIGHLSRGSTGHVVTLDVDPGQRRRGLGKDLLEALLSRLARAGARRVLLEVAEENRGAIAFYEKLGFRRRRRLPDYYAAGRPALEMEKEL